jgi:hypothetical protein
MQRALLLLRTQQVIAKGDVQRLEHAVKRMFCRTERRAGRAAGPLHQGRLLPHFSDLNSTPNPKPAAAMQRALLLLRTQQVIAKGDVQRLEHAVKRIFCCAERRAGRAAGATHQGGFIAPLAGQSQSTGVSFTEIVLCTEPSSPRLTFSQAAESIRCGTTSKRISLCVASNASNAITLLAICLGSRTEA